LDDGMRELCKNSAAIMLSIIKSYIDIALLRAGPEVLPADRNLLLGTVLAFLVLNIGLSLALRPDLQNLIPQHFVSVALLLIWYQILLQLFGKPERFLQTATAIFGLGCIVAPVLVPAAAFVARFAERPEEASPIVLMLLPLAFYVVFVTARILRAAIERPMFQCVLLVIAYTMVEAIVMVSMFGGGAPVTPATG